MTGAGKGAAGTAMQQKYEVIDGLRSLTFSGAMVAVSSTQRKPPGGRRWQQLAPWEQKALSRWVEMELYRVDPGQSYTDPEDKDAGDLIRLPSGGYFFHVIGQSLIYHESNSVCGNGVPTRAADTEIDVVPCPDCHPPLLWQWDESMADDEAVLLADPDLIVDLETPRNSLKRAETARAIVREVEGRQLSTPAQKLLEIAMRNDPDIRKVYAR